MILAAEFPAIPSSAVKIRVGFWQNGFFADFYFWAAGFLRGFSRRTFSPHFCGKKCPEKSSSPEKSPRKSFNIYNKNPPTHFCRMAGAMKIASERRCAILVHSGLRVAMWITNVQGPLNGGVSNTGVSRSGLVLAFLSLLGLSRFFWDFPDLLGDGPGIFLIRPFSLSRPIKSTYEEQSRKGPRHNLDLPPKSGKHPGLETPRFGFSENVGGQISPWPARNVTEANQNTKIHDRSQGRMDPEQLAYLLA